MLGHSGAEIVLMPNGLVRKQGGTMHLGDQAELCQKLGALCPKIVEVSADWYTMERLGEFTLVPGQERAFMSQIHSMLRTIWSQAWPWITDQHWRVQLELWIREHAPWIPVEYVDRLMEDNMCLTHGDPTLANLMVRYTDGKYVLIDPAPPRPGVPPMRGVDVGKMLQSAAGWEHVLEPSWPAPPEDLIVYILQLEPDPEEAREALFWAAFHCARLIQRTTKPHVREWGRRKSEMFVEMANACV